MAANDIDDSFSTQFENDIKLAYQRMGAKLPNTMRRKNNVKGSATTFQNLGKGEAGVKGRNSQVPMMNFTHTPVTCTIVDAYGGQLVDRLDELKAEHDERQAVASSIAASLGRASDTRCIAALDGNTTTQTSASGAVTKAKLEEIYEAFGNGDVPDDGQRYLWVSPQGWTDLLGISEFAQREYVAESELPWRGLQAKRWFSFTIAQHSGLTVASSVRSSHAYHRSAVGFASQAEAKVDMTWQGKEQAWLLVGSIANGACLVDGTGVYKLRHTES